jgi:tetratricopeptide (TPR) repeat protein
MEMNTGLQQRFPSMKPVKSPPSLFTLNSFGIGMYGKRDFDPVTGTYIKTRCLCALFIPIFPLDAYRVADAQKGWYFLGKEPVSGFASGARWLFLALIAGLAASGAWSAHVSSPEYRAKKGREKAVELAAAGKPLEAADVYRDLLRDNLGNRAEWQDAMTTLVRSEITSGDVERSATAVRYADQKKVVPGSRDALVPDLADRALEAAGKCSDPAGAERILSSFKPSPTDLARVHEALKQALEDLHKARPADGEVRIKLALMREEFGEVEGALELLEPAANQLGEGEGARLFGNLLLADGRVAEALPHLERYVAPRQAEWKRVETALERAYEGARTRALDHLNETAGPKGFKARYDAASETEQGRMVDEYLTEKVQQDSSFLAARERYQAESKIAGPIMDLGVARLKMAQAESDPAKRKEFLKGAEEAFLSLRSVAGESDEYRLFLGQIYFWSGRESEGRKLFDELLASKQRNAEILYSLANVFRDLGEDNEARVLLEEAFPKAGSAEEKTTIIGLRTLLSRTVDEKIEWLAKGDSGSPQLAVKLAEAKGEKADGAGDSLTAANHYREALALYEKEGRSAAALNNSALLHRHLYRLEGTQADFEKSARLLSEAIELEPANSIQSFNAADSLFTAAVLRLAADRIHPKLLQYDPGIGSLQFLYEGEEEKDKLLAQLKADPNYRKAVNHFWDALLLAPKDSDIYGWGAGLFNYVGDDEALDRLAAKAAEQEFDFTSNREDFARFLKKERDAEFRQSLRGQDERSNKLMSGLDDPRSKAMAKAFVAGVKIGGFTFGEPTVARQWIEELKAAAKAAPCSRLQSSLEVSLEVFALEALATAHPHCAAIIEANRRLLGPQDILRLLVRAKGDLGERVRKHPAVIEAREMADSTKDRFISSFGLDDWLLLDGLLLDGLHPETDAALKETLMKNRRDRISRSLQRKLQFEGPSALLEQFWQKVSEGDTKSARDLLPKLTEAGVKIPPMF